MPRDLDDAFNDLLRDSRAQDAPPKTRKEKKQETYSVSYTWRLESFRAVIVVTRCLHCRAVDVASGGIFKRLLTASGEVSLTRINSLDELARYPLLPRSLEHKEETTIACQMCLLSFNFYPIEDPNGP